MTQSPTIASNQATLPRIVGGIAGVAVFFCGMLLVGRIRGVASNPAQDAQRAEQSSRQAALHFIQAHQDPQQASQTARYWQLTVVPLHKLRLTDSAGSNESGMVLMRRFTDQFEQTIGLARAASTRDVDPELVKMVGDHLTLDDIILRWLKDLIKIAEDPAQSPVAARIAYRQLTARQLVTQGRRMAQRDDLPSAAKQHLKQMAEVGETVDRMILDTQIMQATLQERYKVAKSEFTLHTSNAESLQLHAP